MLVCCLGGSNYGDMLHRMAEDFDAENNNDEKLLIKTVVGKFNWGAAVFNFIWGLFNGAFLRCISILMVTIVSAGLILLYEPNKFSTIVPFFLCFLYIGAKGSKWAWEQRKWENIEKEWLDLYHHRKSLPGKSVTKHVSDEDEWCAEAYMETDYSTLCDEDFIRKIRDYAAFLVQSEDF